MRILISSHAFAPSIGGIETVSRLLADEFLRAGNEVRVITQNQSEGRDDFPFAVYRRPTLAKLFELVRWCGLFWQNNLSLRTLWPTLFLRRPTVITHQGSYCRRPAGIDFVQRLKHGVVARVPSVAISEAVARCFNFPSCVIPNAFDASLFTPARTDGSQPNDLIFVGRLVTEKGLDVLLAALAELRRRQHYPSLTIVGAGPELAPTQEMARRLGLREQVAFAGAMRGAELAEKLRQHKILVVPSRYDEPFGVVALEGIASGCVVVGSRGGGLPEAIGPCGVTFPNGDATALAAELERLLCAPDERAQLRAHAPAHLARFHPTTIARSYLDLFASLQR